MVIDTVLDIITCLTSKEPLRPSASEVPSLEFTILLTGDSGRLSREKTTGVGHRPGCCLKVLQVTAADLPFAELESPPQGAYAWVLVEGRNLRDRSVIQQPNEKGTEGNHEGRKRGSQSRLGSVVG